MSKEIPAELSAIAKKIAEKICKYGITQAQTLVDIMEEAGTSSNFVKAKKNNRTEEKSRAENMLTLMGEKILEAGSDTEMQIAEAIDDFIQNSCINIQCTMSSVDEDLQKTKFRTGIKQEAEEILALFKEREKIVEKLEAK